MAGPPALADPQRRAQLLSLKLRALVRDNFTVPLDAVEPAGFPWGGALAIDGVSYVLAEDSPGRSLGPALAWSLRKAAHHLHLLVTGDAGIVARRAGYFDVPITVWQIDGRGLVLARPDGFAVRPELDARLVPLIDVLRDAGVVPVVEYGVLTGELLGLELARATVSGDGVPRLEVGVGRHDREAFALLHGDLPDAAALAGVVEAVRRHRYDGGPEHPLNRLAAERRLRIRVCAEPSLIGARELVAACPPVPRLGVKDAVPAVAIGVDGDGRDVVAVCSTGVDLDLVPFAADARASLGRHDDRLVLVVPQRDAFDVQRLLAGQLQQPAELRAVAVSSIAG